jgi:putative phosphoribosyl transferase
MWRDRVEAGKELAARLGRYTGQNAVVLGVPRGGIVVAAEVAKALDLPLGYVLARKIGAPGNPEFGIGAVAADGTTVLDENSASLSGADAEYIEKTKAAQIAEIQRREAFLGDNEAAADLTHKTALVVDDGLATGVTTLAAVRYLKKRAGRVVLAAPVAPPDTAEMLSREADEVILLSTPTPFGSVGAFYYDFQQVEDNEVKYLLAEHNA